MFMYMGVHAGPRTTSGVIFRKSVHFSLRQGLPFAWNYPMSSKDLLFPKLWDYRHTPPCPALYLGS